MPEIMFSAFLTNSLFLEETDSTNSYLARLLASGERLGNGFIVYSGFQTDGRGQMNNHWESERGCNLLFSMLLYPDKMDAAKQFPLSEAVALGITDSLDKFDDGFKVKWPNDIYWHDKKIAGILIENHLHGAFVHDSIIGVGLNVNQEKFTSDAPNPVSLFQITKNKQEPMPLLETIRQKIMRRFGQINTQGSLLHEDYLAKLYRFGEWRQYKDKNGKFTGRIRDVASNGIITVEHESGKTLEYAFKEIEFVIGQVQASVKDHAQL